MSITKHNMPDGGTIICINGIRCNYWYPEDCDEQQAIREAEQYYREIMNGRELLNEKRALVKIGKALGIA